MSFLGKISDCVSHSSRYTQMVSEGLGKRCISDPLFPVLYVSHSFRVLGFLEGKVMLSEASVSHSVRGVCLQGVYGGVCIIGGGQTPSDLPNTLLCHFGWERSIG